MAEDKVGMFVGIDDKVDGDGKTKLARAAELAEESFDCWDQFIKVSPIDVAVNPVRSSPNELSGKIEFSQTRAHKDS
jgi:hypothetical protein